MIIFNILLTYEYQIQPWCIQEIYVPLRLFCPVIVDAMSINSSLLRREINTTPLLK